MGGAWASLPPPLGIQAVEGGGEGKEGGDGEGRGQHTRRTRRSRLQEAPVCLPAPTRP